MIKNFYLPKSGNLMMWFHLCRRIGHQWEVTSRELGNHQRYRCGGCNQEKWVRKGWDGYGAAVI
jgi:hypothetical protein